MFIALIIREKSRILNVKNFLIIFYKSESNVHNIDKKWEPPKWLPDWIENNHQPGKSRMVIFYCICSRKQMMINKAIFIAVTPTNP